MITRADLIKNIQAEFPGMIKTGDYANLILQGVKLKAYDSGTAKKRKDFLQPGIKEHVFSRSYLKLDLLVSMREADRMTVIASQRVGMIFSFSTARNVLNRERELLFAHIVSEPSIIRHVAKSLKLSLTASIDQIKNRMNSGDLMKQVGTYEKVYRDLIKYGVRPRGYMWLGVRTIPVSLYYLSNKSKRLLKSNK